MKTIVSGLPIHYVEHGAGRPLLMLHGWGSNSQIMARLTDPAVNWSAGIRRIYVDLPGHGRSLGEGKIKNSDDILTCLKVLIRQLFEEERFMLLGYSYGGYLAQAIAHHFQDQVAGLCLLNPLIVSDFEKRDVPDLTVFDNSVEIDPTESDLHKILDEVLVVRNARIELLFDEVLDLYLEAPGDVELRQEIQNDKTRYALSIEQELASTEYSAPSLVYTSRQDVAVGYKDALSILHRYPRATFVTMDRSGHLLEEQDHLLDSLIRDWLRRVSLESR